MCTNFLWSGDCQHGDGAKRRGELHRENTGPVETTHSYEIFHHHHHQYQYQYQNHHHHHHYHYHHHKE